ncbi:hypothetical protein L1987_82835 [Smallanthus sonchifolius]|uniref:Uncharacterized protein n=1 Tax=Smallanthus sonchifolius TaxID=185202 RepID=A0ACB8YC22_9ASTR|nr:hypothetical protein L1987_82835 [Smallanthus sonchifolius]
MVNTITRMDGSVSMRFEGYQAVAEPDETVWNRDDQEDPRGDEDEFAGMFNAQIYQESLSRFQVDRAAVDSNRSYYAIWCVLESQQGNIDHAAQGGAICYLKIS